MAKASSTTSAFHKRLNELLEYCGFNTTDEKVEKLVAITSMKPRTVRGWLHGLVRPRDWAIMQIVSDLDLSPCMMWLHSGKGHNPEEGRFIESFRRMTDWEKNKYTRLMIRLRNNDRKVERLMQMEIAGQISRHQLLNMM